MAARRAEPPRSPECCPPSLSSPPLCSALLLLLLLTDRQRRRDGATASRRRRRRRLLLPQERAGALIRRGAAGDPRADRGRSLLAPDCAPQFPSASPTDPRRALALAVSEPRRVVPRRVLIRFSLSFRWRCVCYVCAVRCSCRVALGSADPRLTAVLSEAYHLGWLCV